MCPSTLGRAANIFAHFLVIVLVRARASLISTSLDLCGPMSDIALNLNESSVTVALVSDGYTANCKVRISAPETHVIYLNVVDGIPTKIQEEVEMMSRTRLRTATCRLKVYQNETSDPVWSYDLCTAYPLPEIDLLHPEITLEWTPPTDSSRFKRKKVIVTAVGRGDVCKENLQHVCMTIGHEPLFCVSKYLQCDGDLNCPKGATRSDEDDQTCKLWSLIYRDFKISRVNDKIFNLLMSQTTKSPQFWHDWPIRPLDSTESVTTMDPPASNMESLSVALSHYGPWGYILLGMLICGTVLMFCGVWECFKKPKPLSLSESVPNSPTSVLIINPTEENTPPRYDDLDPPSYATLFPHIKDTAVVLEESPGSSNANQNLQTEEITEQSRTDHSTTTVQNITSAVNSTNIVNTDEDKLSSEEIVATNDGGDCSHTMRSASSDTYN